MVGNIGIMVEVNQTVQPAGAGHKRIAGNKQCPDKLIIYNQVTGLFFQAAIGEDIDLILFTV